MFAVDVVDNDTVQHALIAAIAALLVAISGAMIFVMKRVLSEQAKSAQAAEEEREKWTEKMLSYMEETNSVLRERIAELTDTIAASVVANGEAIRQHESASVERFKKLMGGSRRLTRRP